MPTLKISEKEILLPEYMSCLPLEAAIDVSRKRDASLRIIACGVHPLDTSLCMITGNLDVRQIIPNGKLRPVISFPSHDGKRIGIIFSGSSDLSAIDSELALKNSESCLNMASLFVNDTYMCDLEIDSLSEVPRESDEDQDR